MRRARAIRRVWSAEEDNVKNTVTVSLKKERLASVCIRDILLSGSCRAVLPMDLYRGRKYCFGVYHTAGLQCLRQCKHLTADQALRAAGALLRQFSWHRLRYRSCLVQLLLSCGHLLCSFFDFGQNLFYLILGQIAVGFIALGALDHHNRR